MEFGRDVETVAETHLEGACASDVVWLLIVFAGYAETEDMNDGLSQHELMDAASEAGH